MLYWLGMPFKGKGNVEPKTLKQFYTVNVFYLCFSFWNV